VPPVARSETPSAGAPDGDHPGVTAGVRAVLVALDDLVAERNWPDLGPVTVGHGSGNALVRLEHRRDPERTVEVEVGEHRTVVRYPPEEVGFTSPDEALRFVTMLGDGRVELEVHRAVWTTMYSYRDGLALPFRRTRMPWPTLRARTERRRFGFV